MRQTLLRRGAMCVAVTSLLLPFVLSGCLSPTRRTTTIRTPQHRAMQEPAPIQTTQVAEQGAVVSLGTLRIRVRVMTGLRDVRIAATQAMTFVDDRGKKTIPAGEYVLGLAQATPATRTYHVFSKSFKPSDEQAEAAYLNQWRAQGYTPKTVVLGYAFEGTEDELYDARIHWVSMAQCATEAEANALKKRLEPQGVWSWVRAQVTQPGTARLTIQGAGAPPDARAPLTIESAGPVRVSSAAGGSRMCGGNLEIAVNVAGQLDVIETPFVEDYLRGVVPSEMPPGWPAEALKAQTVAARSELLANIGIKHHLEGFDYCAGEHCRAYRGLDARNAATDAAVAATTGEIIVENGRIVPTVFHSNSGGWTENNEVIWSAPADPALRAAPDFLPGQAPARTPLEMGIERWLESSPQALVKDAPDFRWTRHMTVDEISASVNKQSKVGHVQQIILGERGPGGRLRSVKVIGSAGSATFDRDPSIRLAFGGLPSAMFIVNTVKGPSGTVAFVFTGGGRGHGVGLCQYGARALALQSRPYRAIVAHYFSGSAVERIR